MRFLLENQNKTKADMLLLRALQYLIFFALDIPQIKVSTVRTPL